MITFTATPTGGVGQPPRRGPRARTAGCPVNHSNPALAGDCACADLAAEAAERREAPAQRPVRHYAPSRVVRVPSRFSVDVVGVSFEAEYPANLQRLARQRANGVAWELALVREPANPHDSNAVAVVVVADGTTLGHLPAGLAGRLGPAIDAGGHWSVVGWEVLPTSAHPDRPGLSLQLERAETSPALSQAHATLRLAS